MTLIGRRCTGGDAFSRARLIARTLSGGAFAPRLPSGPVPVPLLSAAILSSDVIEAATARRLHPFPFRTGQLSSGAPMVLRKRESRSPPSSSLPPFPSPSQEGGRGGGRVFSWPCRSLSFLLLTQSCDMLPIIRLGVAVRYADTVFIRCLADCLPVLGNCLYCYSSLRKC